VEAEFGDDFFSELGGGEDIDGLWRRRPYYKNQPSTAKNLWLCRFACR